MQRKFLTYCVIFFIPVIVGYMVMEYLSMGVPSTFIGNKEYLSKEKDNFQYLVLGSSQMQSAVNPEWIDTPTLNLASGDQHHDTDFKLLKGIQKRLPQLKRVILEVSYSHFELPHNGKDFWKNNLYNYYYNINCFERRTYFKDRLLYLSNPKVYSRNIYDHFIEKKSGVVVNDFGFNSNNYQGQFANLGHDEDKIARMRLFKINREPNLQIFEKNTRLFNEFLEYLKASNLEVVICKIPMYKTYHQRKHPDILRRRDSVLEVALQKYSNLHLLDLETDTLHYEVNDYWNQSHLNPKGAKKFTDTLNSFLQEIR